jgi:predicted ATPase
LAVNAVFVKLTPLKAPDRLARYIAAAIELPFGADEEGLAEDVLVRYLTDEKKPRRLHLLILDNCEHLRDAPAKLVDKLLRECSRLRVLVTSRRALELIQIEHMHQVRALNYQIAGSPQVEDLLVLPAIQLFLLKAAIREGDARLRDDDFIAKLRNLSEKLQGIPLCIVLAAARYKFTRDIDSILGDADVLDLSSANPTSEQKERAVRASIEWSERLLSKTARTLLHRVSVFYGGWGNGAVREVCFGEGYRPEFFEAQKELERLHLISVQGSRHRIMNSVVRSYAFERLEESGESEAVLRRHARYYAKLASEMGQKVIQKEMRTALGLLSLDSENYVRAFDWCRNNDHELSLQLAIDLWPYWVVKGLFSFGRSTLGEFMGTK